MYVITYGTLLDTRKWLYETKERCGYLKIIQVQNIHNENEVIPILDDDEKKLEQSQCRINKSVSYSWHSHGFLSKAYPSKQDIVDVLQIKKGDPTLNVLEIIFTIWGIWEIVSKNKLQLSKDEKNTFEEKIRRHLHNFYYDIDLHSTTHKRRREDESEIDNLKQKLIQIQKYISELQYLKNKNTTGQYTKEIDDIQKTIEMFSIERDEIVYKNSHPIDRNISEIIKNKLIPSLNRELQGNAVVKFTEWDKINEDKIYKLDI